MARKASGEREDPAARSFALGCAMVAKHPVFGPLYHHAHIVRRAGQRCPDSGWATVSGDGLIRAHPTRRAEPGQWAYVIGHCLLHLGFGHFQARTRPLEWNTACDCLVARFLQQCRLGEPPEGFGDRLDFAARSEDALYEQLCASGIPEHLRRFGTAGPDHADMLIDVAPAPPRPAWLGGPPDWQACFGAGLVEAVSGAVRAAAGETHVYGTPTRHRSRADQARQWFIDHYPLLGSLAVAFKLIEDPLVCYRLGIGVAAVDMQRQEIYLNPGAGLGDQEMRFVMAHELLHVGLRHDARCEGRDPYLWNVACDFVINGWLVEMGIGAVPQIGLLYDPALKGESAEAIYDRIVTDMRRYRKLATLRGVGLGDILAGAGEGDPVSGMGADLDDFYRRCISQGLVYHEDQGRGLLPAGLIEEIQAIGQPPVPWDVALAQWFDAHFAPLEDRRSYARASRRQSSTPQIPRPAWVPDPRRDDSRTFGVILDTSGSMDSALLARALGAIASYSIAHQVAAVRVVFCDAAAYDQGYMAAEAVAYRVQVKGRGGTVLQPGIDLLERADDFPDDGPLLIITDGYCDTLRIRRDHAFLLPQGRRLPFVPVGPVFRVQ